MPRFSISNHSSGADLGVYEGTTEAEALDAMARDTGYSDFDASCDTLGETLEEARDDLVIVEI